ncbi:hypothetical protein DVH24_041533 [Malus domestica]|uniref:Alpha/beta hydrolase fold-3 domain-containing protein n=1 Tax=Malus domestica TaxID=3750 RepID=A0A498IAB7_MALDO|nr:hypothetical protein DVH24_041533 [Malus domestica]
MEILIDFTYIGGDCAGGNIAHNLAMKTGVESLHCGVKILGAYFSKPIGGEPKGENSKKTMPYMIWDIYVSIGSQRY